MNLSNNKILWIAPVVGLVASIVLSVTTFQYELEKEHSSFIAESNLLFNNIKVSFDELDTVNKNISLLFNTSDVISENRFNLFTKPTLSHYPFIESIYYIPRIKKTDLKKIELQKQNIGYTSFKFRTFPEDTYSPTPSEKYIFPIDFVQPFTVINSTLVGMDILTFKLVQKEIMLSTQMGNTLVFSPGKNIFYAFSSLYYGNEVPNSFEMNIDNVYAILGYKISTSKLLSYIAFPDRYIL
ncbi:MAG: CHASE domain-containing protein, partial [Thiohalomonadales bacterium]